MACSALALERDPLPEAAPWRNIEDRRERLRAGLAAIYGWYERNADSGRMRAARRRTSSRWCGKPPSCGSGPYMAAYHEVLGAKLSAKQRAMLQLALSFFTWRTLVRERGLKQAAAVKAMVQAVVGAGEA